MQRRAATAFPPTRSSNVRTPATHLGFRTFVLQGGEDPFFTDDVLCGIIGRIRAAHPDCAVTLSFGERSRKSYERLHEAGAERYLLRHEAASPSLYRRWHPPEMSLENRMRCLSDLREIGYAVGAGFMVGAPFQTAADLACDLRFIERFQPEMCGIGPVRAGTTRRRFPPSRQARRNSRAICCRSSGSSSRMCCFRDHGARHDRSRWARAGNPCRRQRRDAEPFAG